MNKKQTISTPDVLDVFVDNSDDIPADSEIFYTEHLGWHKVQTFCCFLSLLVTSATVLGIVFIESRIPLIPIYAAMWIVGFIAALLVSPLKFLGFFIKSMVTGITLGLTLCPFFIIDIFTAILGGAIGVSVGATVVFGIPAIFTIYKYVSDLAYDVPDSERKKDYKLIVIAVLAVIVITVVALVAQLSVSSATAGEVEKSLDKATAYSTYVLEHEDRVYTSLTAEDFENGTDGKFTKDSTIFTEIYNKTTNSNGIETAHAITVTYRYNIADKTWSVERISDDASIQSLNVSGTWHGMGSTTIGINLSSKNEMTLKIDSLTSEQAKGHFKFRHATLREYDYEFDFTGNVEISAGEGGFSVNAVSTEDPEDMFRFIYYADTNSIKLEGPYKASLTSQ